MEDSMQPILFYANDCVNMSKVDLLKMEKLQAKLIKASLGLSKYMRTTPLIQALDIKSLCTLSTISSLKLYRNVMLNKSRSVKFYSHLMTNKCKYTSLLSRIGDVCLHNDFLKMSLVMSDEYFKNCVKKFKSPVLNDGLVDSCKMLLVNYSAEDKLILKLLLMPSF